MSNDKTKFKGPGEWRSQAARLEGSDKKVKQLPPPEEWKQLSKDERRALIRDILVESRRVD